MYTFTSVFVVTFLIGVLLMFLGLIKKEHLIGKIIFSIGIIILTLIIAIFIYFVFVTKENF